MSNPHPARAEELAVRPNQNPRTFPAESLTSSKHIRLSFQYSRPIPTKHPESHNRFMERPTIDALETAREIDDLNLTIKNQRLQLDFAQQQLRTLRVRLNRYEAIIGIEEAA